MLLAKQRWLLCQRSTGDVCKRKNRRSRSVSVDERTYDCLVPLGSRRLFKSGGRLRLCRCLPLLTSRNKETLDAAGGASYTVLLALGVVRDGLGKASGRTPNETWLTRRSITALSLLPCALPLHVVSLTRSETLVRAPNRGDSLNGPAGPPLQVALAISRPLASALLAAEKRKVSRAVSRPRLAQVRRDLESPPYTLRGSSNWLAPT